MKNFYKFTSTKYAEKLINEQTLKFTHPSEFNDPFDCKPVINPTTIEEIKVNRPKLYKEFLNQVKHEELPIRRKILKQRINGYNQSAKSGEFLNDLFANTSILCLSSTCEEILMWSHYADNHKGFVAEFEVDENKINSHIEHYKDELYLRHASFNLLAHEVKYSNKRPSLSLSDNNDTDHNQLLNNLLLTKYEGWRYEKEYRVIDNLKGPGSHKYNPILLKSVIFGMNMDPKEKERIQLMVQNFNQINNTSVRTLQANPCPNTFAVVITST